MTWTCCYAPSIKSKLVNLAMFHRFFTPMSYFFFISFQRLLYLALFYTSKEEITVLYQHHISHLKNNKNYSKTLFNSRELYRAGSKYSVFFFFVFEKIFNTKWKRWWNYFDGMQGTVSNVRDFWDFAKKLYIWWNFCVS